MYLPGPGQSAAWCLGAEAFLVGAWRAAMHTPCVGGIHTSVASHGWPWPCLASFGQDAGSLAEGGGSDHRLGMLLAQAVQHGHRVRRKTPAWLLELGTEEADAINKVYLLTFARVLSARLQRGGLKDVNTLSKEAVLDCVHDSWENPLVTMAGGRPRASDGELLQKLLVYEEAHADGAKHFLTDSILSEAFSTRHAYFCRLTLQK